MVVFFSYLKVNFFLFVHVLASLRSMQEEYQRKALGAFQRFGLDAFIHDL